MKKIAVIGHFGFDTESLDGQTVKTKILTDALCDYFGKQDVWQVDTHKWKKHPFKFAFQVMSMVWKAENVLILPAHKGLRVIVPLLSAARGLRPGCKLHYCVIGGWLPQIIKTQKTLKKQLNTFDGIYVETKTMKKALEEQGFANIHVMPNCKKLTVLSPDELVYDHQEPYKLCTFSRVIKEKGIEDAVKAVNAANAYFGRTAYILDIFGQIDPGQKIWFEELQSSFSKDIRYGGIVPFDKSVDILKDYFALLFPTYYDGEGFAGTLLDAMASGVPVIASDWKYNSELIKEGRTGVLFPPRNWELLKEQLVYAAKHPQKWSAMRQACLYEAKQYAPEEVISVLIDNIEEKDETTAMFD